MIFSRIGHGRPESIAEAERLSGEPLSEQNIAFLVMHHVDTYTVGSNWAQPSEISTDGKRINDTDRRYEKMKQDPRLIQRKRKRILPRRKFAIGATACEPSG